MPQPEHAAVPTTEGHDQDGLVRDPERVADVAAIRDLAISYAHAVDDRDWDRFGALWAPDATIDYTASGGIAASAAEVTAWMPGALAIFTWCLHSISTHEIRFTGPDTATGRVHVFNRNGLVWEGQDEVFDVGGRYLDEYVRLGDRWRFARRVESLTYLHGGGFAEVVRGLAAAAGDAGAAAD